MNDKDKPPERGTKEHRQWIRDRLKDYWDKVAQEPADFEQVGVISGSVKTLFATGAELFPDDLEEYTPEELEAYYAKIAQKPKE